MSKTRVPKGEKYWCISRVLKGEIREHIECGDDIDELCYKNNNYFPDRESAEAMVRKLRAVLNGADVIEMPSEEEIEKRREFWVCTPTNARTGFGDCLRWLKSKIVK